MLKQLVLFGSITLLLRPCIQAQIFDMGDNSSTGQVVVETPDDLTATYRERRTRHGAIFALHQEDYYPFNYQTQSAGQYFIEDIIGLDAIKLYGIETGYKMNVSVGSLAVLLNYSMGEASGLSVTRFGLGANVAIDGIFDEPYVVPYAQAGVYQMQFTEDVDDGYSASSAPALNYKFGVLFQLDWIEAKVDPGAKIERLNSSGLENTYIDLFYSEHLPSSGAQDPEVFDPSGEINTASSGEIGIGLKLEF